MTDEKAVRSPAVQKLMEAASLVEALGLLVGLWSIVHEEELATATSAKSETWLSIANALWQAARVTEDLQMEESKAVLEDMAQLAEIRAKMETKHEH